MKVLYYLIHCFALKKKKRFLSSLSFFIFRLFDNYVPTRQYTVVARTVRVYEQADLDLQNRKKQRIKKHNEFITIRFFYIRSETRTTHLSVGNRTYLVLESFRYRNNCSMHTHGRSKIKKKKAYKTRNDIRVHSTALQSCLQFFCGSGQEMWISCFNIFSRYKKKKNTKCNNILKIYFNCSK